MSAATAEKIVNIEAAKKPPMKTLANCTPVEFLRQTNKIRHAVSDLFGAAGIAEIRKNLPEMTGDETDAEKKEKFQKQGAQNFSKILDALLDTNAEATAALLGMMCFRDPKDMENDTGMEYIEAALALFESNPVKDFLLTLVQLALKNTEG